MVAEVPAPAAPSRANTRRKSALELAVEAKAAAREGGKAVPPPPTTPTPTVRISASEPSSKKPSAFANITKRVSFWQRRSPDDNDDDASFKRASRLSTAFQAAVRARRSMAIRLSSFMGMRSASVAPAGGDGVSKGTKGAAAKYAKGSGGERVTLPGLGGRKGKKVPDRVVPKSDVVFFKTAFDEHDTAERGVLSAAQFEALMSTGSGAVPKGTHFDTSHFGEVVSFEDVLRAVYPHCPPDKLALMMSWINDKRLAKGPETFRVQQLAAGHEEEIRSLFKTYDRKKRGALNRRELREALAEVYDDSDEVDALFSKFALVAADLLCFDEFLQLMISTGGWDEVKDVRFSTLAVGDLDDGTGMVRLVRGSRADREARAGARR